MIKTSVDKIVDILKSLGLKRNDSVMLHVSSFSLGRIEGGIKGIFQASKKIIGEEGNIIVPTFTYSFRRKEIFNVNKTPSYRLIGKFSEYIRLKKNSKRSLDPLFSISCTGPEKFFFTNRNGKNCFGYNSIYDRLLRKNILIINLGITYSTGVTAFLHLEKLANVFYRKDKSFYGKTIGHDGKLKKDYAIHFVKKDNIFKNYDTNREKVGRILEKKKISKCINYGYGKHFSMRFMPFASEVINILRKNSIAMLEKKK